MLPVLIRGGEAIEPTVGVHPGVPAHQYHRWMAVSNSWLSKIRKSPAHLLAYLAEDEKPAEHLILGQAFHSAILEPDLFDSQYVRGPEGHRNTKAVKAAWAELEAEHGPGFVIRPTNTQAHAGYDDILRMRDAVYASSKCAALLSGEGDIELTLCWPDESTGIPCKARVDRHSPKIHKGAIIDLKTTADASVDAFERAIFSFGYHRQAAHYLTGCDRLGLEARDWIIIAVEKKPPYGVRPFRLVEAAIEAGEQELGPLMARYAECVETGNWPCYADSVVDVALPSWAWRQAGDSAPIEDTKASTEAAAELYGQRGSK